MGKTKAVNFDSGWHARDAELVTRVKDARAALDDARGDGDAEEIEDTAGVYDSVRDQLRDHRRGQ